ncbi:MAG TPA: hypothetical protein PKO06_00175, partial [Candidatus Ozemobacteraceae bacterium]|nr:hypothetical protein [Candidatus Ozemobacteraceae bacterium]
KASTDLAGTVVQLFRRGKDEAVSLSQDAAIKFALTDLEKEATELAKEAGRVLFDLYQRGDLKYPALLTIGHEILRMNFFIQKYTDEEAKTPAKSGGFFSQIKSLFSKSQPKDPKQSQVERFTQNREDLFLRMGRLAFLKMEQKEFESSDLEGYFQTYTNLQAKIAREKDKMNAPA